MSLIKIEKALANYTTEPMKGNIERLSDFDAFHCLLSGSLSASLKVQDKYPGVPIEFVNWIKICDGGLLFDTVLLSTKAYDKKLDLDFDTYEDMNSEEAYAEFNLPAGYIVFALRSYGDPICFSTQKGDNKVYLWDVETADFSDIWDSFDDWITEEIDDAIRLIADGELEPLDLKIGGGSDE